jgi:hypothetical protein
MAAMIIGDPTPSGTQQGHRRARQQIGADHLGHVAISAPVRWQLDRKPCRHPLAGAVKPSGHLAR